MVTIIFKSNTTIGVVPTAGQLVVGELAVNHGDGKLYTKNASNNVIRLFGSDGPTGATGGPGGPGGPGSPGAPGSDGLPPVPC